jgi:hypothetical protein
MMLQESKLCHNNHVYLNKLDMNCDDIVWYNCDEVIYPQVIMDFWANHSISTMHIMKDKD